MPSPTSLTVPRVLLAAALLAGARAPAHGAAAPRPVAPPMAIGLAGVSSYGDVWQFVDMMKHSREWRARKDWKSWDIVEDAYGWPVSLKSKDGRAAEIDGDHPIFMWLYNRRIAGDIVLTWEGDGDVQIRRRKAKLVTDELPAKKRRVYHWDDAVGGVFELVVARSNPRDHVRNIRVWMPGFETSGETFHPLWKKVVEPFPYFRFMDWGRTNNSTQKDWTDRVTVHHMRQTRGVAYEHMLRLCNEMGKDAWICIPHMATDDYVRQLARLIKKELKPELRVAIEYSNEIWNGSFRQTHWLWDQADKEIKASNLKDSRGRPLKKWEYGATLCGRRSAQIWKIAAKELGDPDRIVRTITHFRWIERAMQAALDKRNGEGRVDLVALNGYFISQDSLKYALRDLDNWDLDEAMKMLEQQHLLGHTMRWQREMANVRTRWPGIPITCYEGGQHFANPFATGLQGKTLVERMFEVNGDPRIKNVYRTALETWHLAGGDGFTAFVECGTWSKYGCWGHKQYVTQPLEDRLDADGNVTEKGAHKYAALLEYQRRRSNQVPGKAPRILTSALPDAAVGQPYNARLTAEGGTPPYQWSLLGGHLPEGLQVRPDGRVAGTPKRAEQLVCIIDCTDGKDQHASRIVGLFIDPAAGAEMKAFDFTKGLPPDWKFLKGEGKAEAVKGACRIAGRDIPFLPASASRGDSSYTAEIVVAASAKLNMHQTLGLALNLSPAGDHQDYLRIVIDGPGRRLMAFSRYVRDSREELWGRRVCNLLRDDGEGGEDPALDVGEYWTLRATVRPGASPGAIDLLISVLDQDGRPRVDPAGHTDVANGMFLLRELPIKAALRQGPFGLIANGGLVKQVRWRRN